MLLLFKKKMRKKLSKKYYIKIPKDVKIIYNEKKNILIFIGPVQTKILKVYFKIYIINSQNLIYVTKIANTKIIAKKKKMSDSGRGTILSKIKQTLLEVSVILMKKLKLIGVGYKAFSINLLKTELLKFNLGFSHFIYYKIPKNTQIILQKSTSLYIFSHSYEGVYQTAANIRKYKVPEPYKGKGILYDNEQIILKQGKKI